VRSNTAYIPLLSLACAGSVTDLQSLKKVMRSNGWPNHDPLSTSPWNAISARGDLSPDPEDSSADGAYDAKVNSTHTGGDSTSQGPTDCGMCHPVARITGDTLAAYDVQG
jgi:hypothetical protein